MDSIRKEEREKRRMLEEMRIAEQETCCMPIIAKSPPLDTDKLVAAVLTADDDLYVDKIASSNHHTADLINEAFDELHSIPTLIEISNLRYIAMGKLSMRMRFYYHGILVPFRPADRACKFDVRVYGMR